MGSYRGKTGSPGSEQPFFPKVRARALTVTPTGEPVNFYYMPVGKSKQYLWDFREWVTLATFSVAAFPSLQRRGGCGINKKSRSHRSAADGVVAHAQMFQNALRSVTRERPPRPRLFGTGALFDGAAT